MNVRFTVPVGMPETVTITLTPTELLALTAALDHADSEFLRSDGVCEEAIEVAEETYQTLEGATAMIFGDDWDLLTNVEAAGEQYDEELFDEDLEMLFPIEAYVAGRF